MINEIAEVLPPFLDLKACTKARFAFKNGTTVNASKPSEIIGAVVSQGGTLDPEIIVYLVNPENQSSGKEILSKIRINERRRQADIKVSDLREVHGYKREGVDIWELEVYVNSRLNKNMHFLVNPATQRVVSGITFQAWKEVVGPELANSRRREMAKIEYNPTTLLAVREEQYEENRDTQGKPIFNTYYAPDWKIDREMGLEGKLHPTMQRFFENFIPDTACREYVFERMMMIVDGRLPIILVMNTLTGTGKGIFVESILRYGVGKDNWIAAPKSWDKSGFNAWMDSKQIVWFDEERVMPDGDQANTNYLKRLANDHQSIEKKGVDVNGVTKVFTSLILTNNQGTKNFRLEEDNRRFSVIDVGYEKMSMIYGDEEASQIAEDIVTNKDNMLRDFWLWLSKNYSTEKYGGPFTLWKGPTYKMFLYESRTLWQKTIIDMCKSGENIKVYRAEVKSEFESRKDPADRTRFPKIGSIVSFLKEFTEDGNRLGTLHRPKDNNDREWWIEVNPYWVSEETKREEELGLKEVHHEPNNNTKEKIEDLEEDFDLDL